MTQISKDRFILGAIYLVAFAVGIFIGNSYTDFNILGKAGMAVFATVIVIWLFSFLSDNSSVFDPYWSVAPLIFLAYLFIQTPGLWPLSAGFWFTYVRFVLLFVLVGIYGVRLTWNFFRGWQGLKHEDWRYQDFRDKTGAMYWTVSLFAIHLSRIDGVSRNSFLLGGVSQGARTMEYLTSSSCRNGMAIFLEARRINNCMNSSGTTKWKENHGPGIWSYAAIRITREISFWWGLYFFALSANPSKWWVLIAPWPSP